MSRFDHTWQKHFKKNTPPEQYIEDYLIKLEKLDTDEFEFWKEFQLFLREEREKRFSDIQAALERTQETNLKHTYSRIVGSEFNNDPLCVYGSICEPGRFNFGALPSYYSNFGALYLADSQKTSFLEKFHHLEGEVFGEGKLNPDELSLDNTPSHLYVRVEVEIESYIDLRKDDTLIEFLKVVKEINPTKELKSKWKSLSKKKNRKKGEQELKTVQNLDHLKASVFEKKFTQWISWLDCPSPSQWLGHYTKESGIQGILYPSVRAESGNNLAVFIENFSNKNAFVRLVDKVAAVPSDRVKIDGTNYLWFSKSLSDINANSVMLS